MQAAWTTVCEFDALLPDVGVRALVGDDQVAVFRLSRPAGVFAIDAFDPFSDAPVLSRGIVGDVKGQLVVASPIYKQHFDLRTGRCLEDGTVVVRTFPVRVVDGRVQVRHQSRAGSRRPVKA
ncbi:MAG: nitrite reductase small subunit NirD [Gammaproteobacteria bacterium]|nr:nitrite reductase small subunit NirD [Gammaproteobacteria bacterium]